MYDGALDNLEKMLRQLAVGYRVYLCGKRLHPPLELTAQVERLVQQLSESADLSSPQRYRLSTLATRYYTYRDLWRRSQPRKVGPQIPNQAATQITIVDPQTEERKIRELYDAFLRLDGTRDPLPWPQFLNYITRQTRRVQENYQGLENTRRVAVTFTLLLSDDAIRFTADASPVG